MPDARLPPRTAGGSSSSEAGVGSEASYDSEFVVDDGDGVCREGTSAQAAFHEDMMKRAEEDLARLQSIAQLAKLRALYADAAASAAEDGAEAVGTSAARPAAARAPPVLIRCADLQMSPSCSGNGPV